jgi:hypothetical protein
MSGSQPTNNQAVQFEQQQAAEADAKEALRQQHLNQGQAAINALFDPQPVMASQTTPFDWSSFNGATGANTPTGYTAVRMPGTTAASPAASAALAGVNGSGSGGASGRQAADNPYAVGGAGRGTVSPSVAPVATAASAPSWGLQDASGKIYKQGDPLSITTQVPTGQTTGGFGDDFYNNYKNTYLNYYMPDEARQYSVAQRDLNYNLARAGTLNSSTAADKAGDLAYNDANARATIQANANNAVGQLQSSIQGQKQDLINQLYSTEDPTLTANLAQSAANASRLATPTLTPAAAFFTPALTAAGAAGQSYLYPGQTYPGGPVGATTGPNVAPANASRGVVTGGSY